MTDVNIIENYFKFLSENKKTSSNTLSAYRRDLDSFCVYVDSIGVDLCNVSEKDVDDYKKILTSNGKSVATVSRHMSSLRTFYKYLSVSGSVDVNPAKTVKNDKADKKIFEVLTEDEIDALLSKPDTTDFKGKRDKAMLELLYATGLKVSELLNLDLSDVNLKMNFIRCRAARSGCEDRIIMLYPAAVRELENYLKNSRKFFVADAEEQALFVNVNGERMTRQGFWKILKVYADSANIAKSITPNTLRHSFATHLLENGADIHDIKEILGHTDISSTRVYSDYIKQRLNSSYLKFNHRSR